jgi:hypothetical protein
MRREAKVDLLARDASMHVTGPEACYTCWSEELGFDDVEI